MGCFVSLFALMFLSPCCSLCTQDNSPGTFQSCIMPKDCETSDWSPWSPCSKTCRASDLSPGYRFRTRSRFQAPIGGGKECPTLEEKEACNIIGDLLTHCPRYFWISHIKNVAVDCFFFLELHFKNVWFSVCELIFQRKNLPFSLCLMEWGCFVPLRLFYVNDRCSYLHLFTHQIRCHIPADGKVP